MRHFDADIALPSCAHENEPYERDRVWKSFVLTESEEENEMSGKPKKSILALHADDAIQNPFFPKGTAHRSREYRLIILATLSGIALGTLALFPASTPTLVSATQPLVKDAQTLKDGGPADKSTRRPSLDGTAPIAATQLRRWG